MSRHLLTHVPRQPLRSSVRRRLAVILEPTVLAAALITSRRYALSRFLLEARNRARAPLSAPSSLSEALRPTGLRFPSTGYAHRVLSVRSFHRRDVPPSVRNTSAVPLRHSHHSMRSAIPMRNAAFKCPFRVSVRTSLRPGPFTSRPLHHSATLSRYAVVTAPAYARAAPTAPLRPSVLP